MKKVIYLLFINWKAKHHINTGYFFRTSSNMMGVTIVDIWVWFFFFFFFFCRKCSLLSRPTKKGPDVDSDEESEPRTENLMKKNVIHHKPLGSTCGASSLQWVCTFYFLSVRAKRPNCGNYTWLWFQFFYQWSCNPKEKESSFYIVKYFLKHCSEKVNFDNSDQESTYHIFYKIKCFKTDGH